MTGGEARSGGRVFFALQPDAPTRARLASLAAAVSALTGGRPVPASNVHLTLVFVGAVDASGLAVCDEVARAACEAAAPFEVSLDAVGRFPGAAVAWAAPSSPAPGLLALQEALRRGCVEAGLAVEARRFAPHVTLVRKARGDPAADALGAPIVFGVPAFVLMRSSSTADGVVYRALSGYGLTGSGPSTG